MFNVQCSMFNGESPLQLPASRAAALVAALVVAPLGDVLLARCSGSSLRVNLHVSVPLGMGTA